MLNRDEDILQAAENWQKAGHGVALATVVETWGSAPRPAGSSLVINDDGTFLGSVSGGCVEGAVVTEALDVIASGKPKMLEFGVADETAWNVGSVLRRHHPRLRREGGPVVKLETLTQVNTERAARRPVIVITDTANGEQRLVKAKDIATDPLSAELSKQLAHGQERHDRERRQKAVPQCLRADRAARDRRRGPYQPGAGAAGALARLRRDGGGSAHGVRQPRALSRRAADRRMARRGAAAAQYRSLHGVRRRHARSEDRRSGAAARLRARLLLYRRAGLAKDPRQACRAAEGAGRVRRRHRAHSCADRAFHRRGVAVGDRGLDHGRDHRRAAAAQGRREARRKQTAKVQAA